MTNLTYNKSYDGGTFEEETRLQKFSRLLKLRGDAEWLISFYVSIDKIDMAKRYHALFNYINNKLYGA